MKVLIALVGGYLIGARAGSRDFDQLSKSLRALYESEEFDDFVQRVAHPRQSHAARAGRRPRSRRRRWSRPTTSSSACGSSPPATDDGVRRR